MRAESPSGHRGLYRRGHCQHLLWEAVPAVDGNVLQVASRYFGIRKDIGSPAVQRRIRGPVAAACQVGDYNQA